MNNMVFAKSILDQAISKLQVYSGLNVLSH